METDTDRFDELSVFEQLRLVFDVIARNPCLYLVSHSLEFLYLGLEIRFKFLFLCLVCRGLHFVINALEEFDALGDLFERSVNFSWMVVVVV